MPTRQQISVWTFSGRNSGHWPYTGLEVIPQISADSTALAVEAITPRQAGRNYRFIGNVLYLQAELVITKIDEFSMLIDNQYQLQHRLIIILININMAA